MIYNIRANNKSIDDMIYEFTRDCMYDNISILEEQYTNIISINESGFKEKFIGVLKKAYEAIKNLIKKVKNFILGIFTKQKSKKLKEKIQSGPSESETKNSQDNSSQNKSEDKSEPKSEPKEQKTQKPLQSEPFYYYSYNEDIPNYINNIFSGQWDKGDTVESVTKAFKEKLNVENGNSVYAGKIELKSVSEDKLIKLIDDIDSWLKEDKNTIDKLERNIDQWQKERIDELEDLYDKDTEAKDIERMTGIYTKKYNAARICIQEYASFIARIYNKNLDLINNYYDKFYA